MYTLAVDDYDIKRLEAQARVKARKEPRMHFRWVRTRKPVDARAGDGVQSTKVRQVIDLTCHSAALIIDCAQSVLLRQRADVRRDLLY
jgi:hypothetical protein